MAKKYNTTVDKIKQQNNLLTNNLTIGQQLNIPTSEFIETPTTTTTYTVTPGDTLYSIARLYNTTVNNIKTQNNLTSNLLTVGQQLLIPNQ
ncbi:MAG: LysM peptidoglycan-binding domain-containing protein [Bacilli bacterium]|nr:LysM peptidoglycan-binding domain-containing protein [Bacilli bacterium]